MFQMSEQIDKLAAALVDVQALITNPLTDSKNPHFESDYVSLAGLIDHTRELLADHGLAMLSFGNGDKLVTMLLHSTGQYIMGDFNITPDRNNQQAIGSAITYVRRYLEAAMLNIAPDTDDDANAATKSSRGGAATDPLGGDW